MEISKRIASGQVGPKYGERQKGSTFFVLPFGVSLWEGAIYTKAENEHSILNEYQIGNVLYQVTPVFENNIKAEDITDKIMRLILKDQERKTVEP